MKILLVLVLASSLSGCVQFTITTKNGTTLKYSAPAFGTKQIKRVDLEKGIMEGYGSVQSDLAEVFAAGMAAGMKLAKP